MVKRVPWLSVTPEPERELPAAVATLRHGGPQAAPRPAPLPATRSPRRPPGSSVWSSTGASARGTSYLHGVVELIERRAGDPDPEVAQAREVAIAVIANHHNLLLALPGRAARRTETDRRRLAELLATRNEEQP